LRGILILKIALSILLVLLLCQQVNMAAAANMVAASQFPTLTPAAAAVPGLPGLPGLAGLAPAAAAVDTSISATPTEQLVVTGIVTAATLTSDEEYQEVRGYGRV
jgi:hypothetical protein